MNINCCDRCGRALDLVRINIPVVIDFAQVSKGIVDNSFSKEICADCCGDLATALTAFMAAGSDQQAAIQTELTSTLSKFGPIPAPVDAIQVGPLPRQLP